jgi:hypothetical protein
MDYSFDIEHAQKYGLHEAILLRGIIFWIRKNKANKKHEHEGHTWTYNSREAWAAQFAFLTTWQVRKALESLRDQGVLLVGNYNTTSMDRTTWYAIQDESLLALHIGGIPPMDRSDSANGLAPDHQSLILGSSFSKKSSKKSKELPAVAGTFRPLMLFLEELHGGQYANYKKEGPALSKLIERVGKMYPEGAADERIRFMGQYLRSLSGGHDKFWATVPVSPSSLLCHWDRLFALAKAKASAGDWEHMSSPLAERSEE